MNRYYEHMERLVIDYQAVKYPYGMVLLYDSRTDGRAYRLVIRSRFQGCGFRASCLGACVVHRTLIELVATLKESLVGPERTERPSDSYMAVVECFTRTRAWQVFWVGSSEGGTKEREVGIHGNFK